MKRMLFAVLVAMVFISGCVMPSITVKPEPAEEGEWRPSRIYGQTPVIKDGKVEKWIPFQLEFHTETLLLRPYIPPQSDPEATTETSTKNEGE